MKNPRLIAALVLGLPLAACDQVTPSLPVCTITGQVTIEGMGVGGVLVTLSTGNSTTTDESGNFRFVNVEGGTVTITIGHLPSDATFDQSATTITTPCDGTVTINFSGSWIHTARN